MADILIPYIKDEDGSLIAVGTIYDKDGNDITETYATKDELRNIYFVKGTQTATTGSFTGAIDVDALYDGITIAYYLPYAGSGSATLNLTLSDGTTTGAKNIYIRGTTRLTTHYAAGSIIYMTYLSSVSISGSGTYTGWFCHTYYASDIVGYRLRWYNAVKCNSSADITSGTLAVGKNDGYYYQLGAGVSFDISQPILYFSSAVSASATSTNGYYAYDTINLATTYSSVTTYVTAAYKTVYLVGTLSGTTFTTISGAYITATVPTSADGYVYMPIGMSYGTAGRIYFHWEPVFYYHDGTSFKQYSSYEYTLPTASSSTLGGVKVGSGLAISSGTLSLGSVTASDTTSTASPAHSGTVTVVDSVTRDSYGRVTGVNTKTVTLPSDQNTDTKVTNTASTSTKFYVTGTSSSSTNTGTQYFDTGVYVSTTAGELVATKFTGTLNGNATSATKATQDGSGNVITDTYMKKSDVTITLSRDDEGYLCVEES